MQLHFDDFMRLAPPDNIIDLSITFDFTCYSAHSQQ